MRWRGLLSLTAATVSTATIVVAAGGLFPGQQESAEIVAALARGRIDEGTVTAAKDAVADGERAGDVRLQAAALEQLGEVHTSRGEYAEAQSALQRAVSLWSGMNERHAEAGALERLADAQLKAAALDDAGRTIDRLRLIREQGGNLDPPEVARSLELDATILTRRGQYLPAQEILGRAFAIAGSVQLSEKQLASMLRLRGDLAYFTGDLQHAPVDYDAAVAAARRAFPDDHPALAPYLRQAALARTALGDLAEARNLRLRALELTEAALPPCHRDLLISVNDLAISNVFFGDYIGARRLFERALTSSRTCLGPTHSLTATALGNLGEILKELGDLREAESMQRQAITAWIANRGPTHPFVALAIEGLGDILDAQGRFTEAIAEYDRASAIRAKGSSPDPAIARLLGSRARVLSQQRRFTAALRDLDRAAAMLRTVSAVEVPGAEMQAQLELLRGQIEERLGNVQRARAAYAAALAMREEVYEPSHPLVAEARASMARVEAASGATAQAIRQALEADATSRDHLRRTVRYLSERQALDYVSLRPQALDLAIALAADANDQRAAFDALIRSRGLVLDELAARAQAGHDDPAVAPDVMKRFISARQRYANLTVQSLRETVPRDRLDAARDEAESAERLVAEQSVAARAERAQASAGVDQVLAALPAKAALVAFVRYQAPVMAARPPSASYGAFVVDADRRMLTFVKIGTAARVDALVASWRAEASRRNGTGMVAAGVALRRSVWDPVAAVSGNASRIFIVPDGALSLVSFAALPRSTRGYLVEDDRVLHELSTERDLLVSADRAPSSSALIVGGPAFAGNRPTTQTAMRAGIDCRGARPLAFTELPGARVEAREVSSLWAQTGSQQVVVLSGADATETAVKEALSRRRVIHLATHGFFFGDGCERRAPGARAVGGVVGASAPAALVRNPLSLSGLAFAGANRHVPGATDDGILTAEEIASLDLSGTEWAVLSACDTGLGQIRSGEGVLGLRRAFQIAGARTVIMSLWSVDDQATRLWMQALYEARLTRHLDTADSVRAASIAMLTQRRAAHQSTHPFYWAAFVAAGDYR